MILHLLRHGIAVDRTPGSFASDADRLLTDRGRERLRIEALGMRALGLTFDFICTSPLLRAHQTAQIVAQAYGMESEIVVTEALAPGSGFDQQLDARAPIVRHLNGRQFEHALLVGHEPDLSELASLLLTGSRGLNVQFKKGALCAIAVAGFEKPHLNELLWLLAPRQVRALVAPTE
jgi:phosphohistidine phosphatase